MEFGDEGEKYLCKVEKFKEFYLDQNEYKTYIVQFMLPGCFTDIVTNLSNIMKQLSVNKSLTLLSGIAYLEIRYNIQCGALLQNDSMSLISYLAVISYWLNNFMEDPL